MPRNPPRGRRVARALLQLAPLYQDIVKAGRLGHLLLIWGHLRRSTRHSQSGSGDKREKCEGSAKRNVRCATISSALRSDGLQLDDPIVCKLPPALRSTSTTVREHVFGMELWAVTTTISSLLSDVTKSIMALGAAML